MSMEYKCDICNKNYKTYQTLWNHNKNFHNITSTNLHINPQNNTISPQISTTNNHLVCSFCNKHLSRTDSLKRHEKTCKEKDKELSNVKQLEIQLKIKEQEILKLKLKLQKSKKADIVTVNQLNKLLLERHKQYQNYINNGNINNYNGNVVNNIQLIGFGKEENIIERLTYKEKKLILNSRYKSLEKLIEIVHCGKYNEFKNILVTNAKDNYAYKYNSSKGQFVLSTKDEVINSLIDNRMYELETIYDSFLEENKIDEKTKDIIEIFINKINNDDIKYTDSDGNTHDTYKHYKVDQVKLILYNNKDKMISDISLILTTSSTNEIII